MQRDALANRLSTPFGGTWGPRVSIETVAALVIAAVWGFYLYYVGAKADGDGPYYLQSAFGILNYAPNTIGEQWAPLFPILIAVAGVFVRTLDVAATLVVVVSYGAALLLLVAILRHNRVHPLLTLVILAYIAANRVFARELVFLHSEPPFMVFLLAHVLALQRHIEHPDRTRWLVVAGLAAMLATLTRYAGYPILGLFLAYLAYCWFIGRVKFSVMLTLAIITVAPNFLYVVRNWLVAGDVLGLNPTWHGSVRDNLRGIPLLIYSVVPRFVYWLVVLTLLAVAWMRGYRARSVRRLFSDPDLAYLGYLVCLVIGYTFFLVWAETRVIMPPLARYYRMITPFLPVLFVIALLTMRRVSELSRSSIIPLVMTLAMVVSLASNGYADWERFTDAVGAANASKRDHLDFGFRTSETRRRIAAYLRDRVRESREAAGSNVVLITGIYDVGMKRLYNAYPEILLFRRSIVADATVLGYSNVYINGRGGYAAGSQFDVDVKVADGTAKLRYRSLHRGCCWEWSKLRAALGRIAGREHVQALTFFVDDITYKELGPPPADFARDSDGNAPLRLIDDTWIEPYHFLRWMRPAAADAAEGARNGAGPTESDRAELGGTLAARAAS